jgi:hypothetical protein
MRRPSDYDVALVFQPGVIPRLVTSRKRLAYRAIADLDIVVFPQLAGTSLPLDRVACDCPLATYALAAELSRER